MSVAAVRLPDVRVATAAAPVDADGLDAFAMRCGRVVRSRLPRTRRLMREGRRCVAIAEARKDATDVALRGEFASLRPMLRRGRCSDGELGVAVAVAGEIARRTLGLAAHPNQFAASRALVDGCLVELATGEGKTLAAAIAAAVQATRGAGCHVVTANDYLAERDAAAKRGFFAALGLACASITERSSSVDRAGAYAADVTYAPARELAADYLRARLALRRLDDGAPLGLRRVAPRLTGTVREGVDAMYRLPSAVIVDEADAVMIDDAATPLVLSQVGDAEADGGPYGAARAVALSLRRGEHFAVDAARKGVELTPAGRRVADAAASWPGDAGLLPRERDHLVTNALAAEHCFLEGVDYVLAAGDGVGGERTVVIVDQSTGRAAHDRSWRGGIHQAVQAKHGVTPTHPSVTSAAIPFQRLFRLPFRLSGLTGTAANARGEFARVYGMPLAKVPTHRPCARTRERLRFFADGEAADRAAAVATEDAVEGGQPVLIASDSVARSERLSAVFRDRGIAHRVLNAVRNADEAAVIAAAGERGAVTIATAMAGRGTDIKPALSALQAGGLRVITLHATRSRRHERQMVGRAARQGQPGHHTPMAAADDVALRHHTPALAAVLSWLTVGGRLPSPLTPFAEGVIRLAQRRGERRAASARAALARQQAALDLALTFAHRH